MEQVILVDEFDRETGVMEKLEAHRLGLLHRAFSVLLFNAKGELLLQRRALHKYHSGGLWTNTCCSHPRPGESLLEAAARRLMEEMGINNVSLSLVDHILYKVEFDNGLTEYEYDHILEGNFEGKPVLNTEEAADFKWMTLSELQREVTEHPQHFTYWFRYLLQHQLLK